ncbi:hypothetical protein Tdes44962_MAKER06735 [Teratosphaeria destructans]|uniref:Uncharacterized protein n=1 Tax=Teratosphaeria destructans TaxID=418781 RepID=A0A9W7T1C6_9PEZI|nr:hypothetical protein Tdes44962_MAKER06735 [Teratosphaeria destructans]
MAELYTETVVYFATWSGTDTATPISTETFNYLLTGSPTTYSSTSTVTHVESAGSTPNTVVQVIAVPITIESGGGVYTATDASDVAESTLTTSSTLGPVTSTYTRTYTEITTDASGALETTTFTSTSTGIFSPSTLTSTYTTTELDASGVPESTSTVTTTKTLLPTLGTFTSTYTTTTSDAAGKPGTSTVTTTSYGLLPFSTSTATPASTAGHAHSHKIAAGIIAAIVVGALAGIALTALFTWWFLRHRAKNQVFEIQPSLRNGQIPRSPGREAGFGLQKEPHEKDSASPSPPSWRARTVSDANSNATRSASVMVPTEPPERGSILNPTSPLPLPRHAHAYNVELEGDIPTDVSMKSRVSKARRYFRKSSSGEGSPKSLREQGSGISKPQKAKEGLGF